MICLNKQCVNISDLLEGFPLMDLSLKYLGSAFSKLSVALDLSAGSAEDIAA